MIDLKSSKKFLCTSCNRRVAIYLRRSSGERLCSICFERSLIKIVKRSLRDVKDLKPGIKLASLVIPERLVTSITTLYILNKIEGKYNCKVVAVLPVNECYRDVVDNIINSVIKPKVGIDDEFIDIINYGDSRLNISSVEVFNKYVKLTINSITKYNVVALPLTLNDLSEIILTSLLSHYLENIPTQPSFKLNSQTFIIPFYNVPEYDVYIYSYIRGIYDLTLDDILTSLRDTYVSEDQVVVKELVRDLSYNNPELTQTLVKSFNKIVRGITFNN